MLQRIQTYYLFIAVLISISLFYVPVLVSDYMLMDIETYVFHHRSLKLLTIAIGITVILTMLLFENRELQIRLCYVCLSLIVLLIGLLIYFQKVSHFSFRFGD